jgi:hypothetical protein
MLVKDRLLITPLQRDNAVNGTRSNSDQKPVGILAIGRVLS